MEEFDKVLTIDGDNLAEIKVLNSISNNIRKESNIAAEIYDAKLRPLQEAYNRIATEAKATVEPLNIEYQQAEKDFWDMVFKLNPELDRATPVKMDRASLDDCDSIELKCVKVPETVASELVTTEVESNVVSLNADKNAEATEKAGA